MRCPNCHSVVGKNYGTCPYCGYDIGSYVRNVQDQGKTISGQRRDRKSTRYVQQDADRFSRIEFNYENGYLYYKRAYEKEEKKKNEKYRQTVVYAVGGIILLLHAAELILLAAIYTL